MSLAQPDQNDMIAARLADTDGVLRALERAGRAVLEQARQSGEPVVIWRNGRIEHVPAEELLAEESQNAGEQ